MERVLIAGGSGFTGNHISGRLQQSGCEVSILSRKPPEDGSVRTYQWSPSGKKLDPEVLRKKDVIINLSGAGLADRLWTKKRKQVLLDSRIDSTRLLIDTLLAHKINPKLFINASAIGFYGHRPGETLTEASPKGDGFLSRICNEWEDEVGRLEGPGIACAILRIGLVLSDQGGGFPKLMRPFRFGVNALFGKGLQHISWIHVDDLVKIVYALITGALIPGTYNCVAPGPVRQETFNKELLNSSGKRAIRFVFPAWLLRLFMGDMSQVLLSDQHVIPEKLIDQHYVFSYPDLHSALLNLLDKPKK